MKGMDLPQAVHRDNRIHKTEAWSREGGKPGIRPSSEFKKKNSWNHKEMYQITKL
jgi:hypothetical protein